MRRHITAAFAMSISALVLAGCGSGEPSRPSGNAGLTQTQLLARMQSAIAAESALHMKGTITDNGTTVTVDMQLNRDGSAQGSTTVGKAVMPIVVVDGIAYTQVTASYAVSSPSPSDAKVGQWIEVQGQPPSSADNFALMVAELDAPSKYAYTYKDTTTIDGVAVARYDETDLKDGLDKVLSIRLTGAALPVAVAGGAAGGFTFVWDQPTKVAAPPRSQVVISPASNS